jgi:hypothetical protein
LNVALDPPIRAEATAQDFTCVPGFRIVAIQPGRAGAASPIRALDLPAEHQ